MQLNKDDHLVATVSIALHNGVTEAADDAHVEGTVVIGGGDAITFTGWLELMGLLERTLLRHRLGANRHDP